MDEQRQTLRVNAFAVSDRGRVRETNEDSFLVAELTKALRVMYTNLPQAKTQYSDERGYLLVVADGMGGHQAGERASALAVSSIETFTLNTLKWFFHLRAVEEETVLREFQAAMRAADARIFQESDHRPELSGMGTTVTMAYSLGAELFVAHVGDSRCYLLRGGQSYQLTRDHTLVNELVQAGSIRPEQASRHALRHVITNAVGGAEPGVKVEAHKLVLEPGDLILLCSDGLTEMLPDARIREVLGAEPDLQRAGQRLVQEANEAGGRDNITVVLARFDAPTPGGGAVTA